MNILVINCGSSSLKADILQTSPCQPLHSLGVERIGTSACTMQIDQGKVIPLGQADHLTALTQALPALLQVTPKIDAVGHRVVHGGEMFDRPVRINAEVESSIEKLIPLAPLHNPANLVGIRVAKALLPDVVHVAVFDTAFHATLPKRARSYAIPTDLAQKHGFRRYGFHGPSHAWVAQKSAEWLEERLENLRLITCHLGNGCSVAAVEYGRSVETSMGMTPLEGLVMGTRSGDIDPGILIALLRQEGMDVDKLDRLLNQESGLKGVSGAGNDLRDIMEKSAQGDEKCRLALHLFTHRLRKYIGAYAAVMGGVDAIVFTAGIGENSPFIRHRVLQRLSFLGAQLDEDFNRDARVDHADPVFEISRPHSRTRLLVVKTDEAQSIAKSTAQLVLEEDRVVKNLTIPIAISARHLHLTQAAVEQLFGEGHTLTSRNELSQPGQFACHETVTVVGPKRSIERVRVLGPVRPACQVEVSRTDEFYLGIDAPIRNSGDVKNSPGVTLIGAQGRRLTLKSGLICARRHIHMTPQDAELFGVQDRDVVEVSVDSEGRDLTFGDVLIRVKSSYALEMHLDTDEANAAEIRPRQSGLLIGTSRVARLRHRKTR